MEYLAPAKLNLSLSITGVKAGYHLLDTIVQEIDLRDVLTVEPAENLQVFMSCGEHWEEAGDDNTACVAARLFFSRVGSQQRVRIRIQKNIPEQAGLGGGSSDGTAVLKALNQMFGEPLSEPDIERLAEQISADSPFFCRGGIQRARGFGEKLEELRCRLDFRYLLVKPDCGICTRQAYAMYDALPKMAVDTPGAVAALEDGNQEAFFSCAGNALLPAALELEPQIAIAGQDCLRLGARFWSLTGSGSCIFAIFEKPETLLASESKLREIYPFVCSVSPSHIGAERRM